VETRMLSVKLTDVELLERGHRVAELWHEIRSEEDAKKQAAAESKRKLDALEEESYQLARQISSRSENRPVEVRRDIDYGRGVEEVMRLDTGEIVETRVLTPAERQVELLSVGIGRDAAG